MTRAELCDLVKSIKYKPGFTIKILGEEDAHFCRVYTDRDGPTEPYRIEMKMDVVNAYDQSKTTSILFQQALTADKVKYMTKKEAVSLIHHLIVEMERHEAGEFFLVDGERPFDPHK